MTKEVNWGRLTARAGRWLRTGSLLAFAGASLSVFGADREFFVAPEGDDVNNDGLSWASPFKTIQKAIDQQTAGEYFVVTVSNGTYLLDKPILLSTSISGGVHLRSFSGNPADVIIDGCNRCACLWSPYSQQRSWYEGITFQNGLSEEEDTYKAGGLYAEQRCFVTNCIIRNCSHVLTNGTHATTIYGGGVVIENQADSLKAVDHWGKPSAIVDTLIENCAVNSKTKEKKGTYGGGAYVLCMNLHQVTIRGCAVTNDTPATYLNGGGLYAKSSVVSNCTVVGNEIVLPSSTATGGRGSGGGVYMTAGSADPASGKHGLIVDSVVAGNVTSGNGAGVAFEGPGRLLRVAITNNVAISVYDNAGMAQHGGALTITGVADNVVDWMSVEDCLIEGNDYRSANTFAGGVSVYDRNCVRISGTVIRNNKSSVAGGLNIVNCSDVIVTNCVIAGNEVTNEVSAVRLQNNIFKTRGTTEVAGSPNRNKPVQFVDSFIVANKTCRPSLLQNGGGIFYCAIGNLANNKEWRVAYVTPVLVRNCLFAGNEENIGRGWCFRFNFFSSATDRMAYFDGQEGRPVVIDHCTIAGNRNTASMDRCVTFAGSSAAADNVSIRDTVISDNLYNSTATNPKTAIIYNDYPDGTPEIIRTYADKEDDCLKVTPENGNIVGGDLRFVDPANGNYALAAGSCLVDKGGPFADWMGDGRRRSPSRDLSGGYVIEPNGPYGVAVTRPNSNPRRYGEASDIGCCEWWTSPGLLLMFK